MTNILAAVPVQHSFQFAEDNHDDEDYQDHDDHYEGHDGDVDENDDHSDHYKGHGNCTAFSRLMALTLAIMIIRKIIKCNCIELTENKNRLKTAFCFAFNQSNQVQVYTSVCM